MPPAEKELGNLGTTTSRQTCFKIQFLFVLILKEQNLIKVTQEFKTYIKKGSSIPRAVGASC